MKFEFHVGVVGLIKNRSKVFQQHLV